MNDKLPLVSISCITFNHEHFLHQCFDSFLMQQTNFAFEIVVHDDASTDNTRSIIEQYCQKYPGIFVPMFQTENQYSKGVRGMNARFNFPRCRGKYIALCEGDDYWTDPLKLQKQVDFLEHNPDVNFSMGRVNFFYQKTNKLLAKKEFIDPTKHSYFTLKDYLKQPFSQTSTFVFRNTGKQMPAWISEVMAGDQSLVIIMTGKTGKIKFHDDFFSVYRLNENSVMQGQIIKVLKNNFKAFRFWDAYLDYEFKSLIRSRIIENYILYYMFRPKIVRKLYKSPVMENILQFVYKGIMSVKNKLAKN